jgi:hypothetical protein
VRRDAQHDLFGDDLDRRRDVHLALRDGDSGARGGPPKSAIELRPGHRQPWQ